MSENTNIIVNEDPEAKKIYAAGFRLAINYLYAKLEEESEHSLNKKNFAEFVNNNLAMGVEDDFFTNNPILSLEEAQAIDNRYDYPLCPDSSGGCMKCPDAGMGPV